MPAMPCRDRLAVWTFEEAGEEIPNGDPSVTDVERAAAGRETLAERFAPVLPGNRRRFDAHLRFVTGEVLPWADERFGPVSGPWVAAGFSNGAAWAIAAAQRRPDLIGAVAAFSAGVVPRQISGAARSAGVRHYVAAGTLEPGFRRSTRQWAGRLDRAGLVCRHEEWTGGHDQVWWEQQLPVALGWLLQAQGA
jgi:enterochelin esterase-like enzyme